MIAFNGKPKYSAKQIATALREAGEKKAYDPTPEQTEIIESLHFGPTVVIAGAGSGKTETMALRILWLVANGIVKPDEVLGLTFTRKAAGELAARVRTRLRQLKAVGFLPKDPETNEFVDISVTVATYHSYAGRVLSEHSIRMGIDAQSDPIGEAAAWQIANNIVRNFENTEVPLSNSLSSIVDKVMDLSSALGEHGRTTADIRAFSIAQLENFDSISNTKTNAETLDFKAALNERVAILPMVEAYDKYRTERGLLTFNDQMSLAAALVTGDFSRALSKEDQLALAADISAAERAKYKVVILDEYQDTSYSQVRFLSALYGKGHSVTAVGDPNQAIYGWRSASAETLTTFSDYFTRGSAAKCVSAKLLITWRNDAKILDLANKTIDVIAEKGNLFGARLGQVDRLALRPKAGPGELLVGQYETFTLEADAIAEYFEKAWFEVDRETVAEEDLTSFAVLVRSRKYIEEIEQALRAKGIPVEVVGLGGLIHTPEVADILALLRTLTFPDAGSSLARLLLGPRLNLGARDLSGLGKYARSLVKSDKDSRTRTLVELLENGDVGSMDSEDFAIGSAIEALEVFDKAPTSDFSKEGYSRLKKFGEDLTALRRQMGSSITDALIEAERFLYLDTEVLVRDGWQEGRKHLDRFLDEAAKFQRNGGTISSFLDWLKIADKEEGGLKPVSVAVNKRAVQILTIHAAKGLEWDFVAVPGLVKKNFPSSGKGLDLWTKNIGALPIALRGDRDQLRDFVFPTPAPEYKQVKDALAEVENYWKARRDQEEFRLAYVAFTRAKSHLICTASWFGAGVNALEMSELHLLVSAVAQTQSINTNIIEMEKPNYENPLKDNPRTGNWPRKSARVFAVKQSAEFVNSTKALELTSFESKSAPEKQVSLVNDAVALISELENRKKKTTVYLPTRISVSTMINLAKAPEELALNIRRPMPNHIDKYARRGTAFHLWLEKRFSDPQILDESSFDNAESNYFDSDEIPLKELQEKWLASEWESKAPVEDGIEVPFETVIGGTLVRGRIDAVYEKAGIYTVVDWKTGRTKSGDDLETAKIQLAMYRLAFSRLYKIDLAKISAAFFYVGSSETVHAADLLSEDQLISIITGK